MIYTKPREWFREAVGLGYWERRAKHAEKQLQVHRAARSTLESQLAAAQKVLEVRDRNNPEVFGRIAHTASVDLTKSRRLG